MCLVIAIQLLFRLLLVVAILTLEMKDVEEKHLKSLKTANYNQCLIKRRKKRQNKMILLHDNATSHRAKLGKETFKEIENVTKTCIFYT